MTQSTIPTQNDILKTLTDAIRPQHKKLENGFECMYWAQELELAADELKLYANNLFEDNLYTLYENGLSSTFYQILFPTQVFHTVNYAALETNLPGVYEKLVYVSADDAMRIIGKKKLYTLCMKEDMARTKRCETIALEDLRKVLKEDEIGPYLIQHEKPRKPVIVPLTGVTP